MQASNFEKNNVEEDKEGEDGLENEYNFYKKGIQEDLDDDDSSHEETYN